MMKKRDYCNEVNLQKREEARLAKLQPKED
jgi:hypothetical protein